MDKKRKKKILLWDWKQKLGIFFIILAFLLLVISLICFASASFINQYNKFLGDGFWCLNHYGLINIFKNWFNLDNDAAIAAFVSHPFSQVYFAIFALIILAPFFLTLGIILLIRGWWKSRI